jgi:putative ABC transport system permease protein
VIGLWERLVGVANLSPDIFILFAWLYSNFELKERIREIGVMKALGATMRDIRVQYLLEAGVLGIVNSLIGIALVVTVSLAIGSLAGLPLL